jgi:hypothetical protein
LEPIGNGRRNRDGSSPPATASRCSRGAIFAARHPPSTGTGHPRKLHSHRAGELPRSTFVPDQPRRRRDLNSNRSNGCAVPHRQAVEVVEWILVAGAPGACSHASLFAMRAKCCAASLNISSGCSQIVRSCPTKNKGRGTPRPDSTSRTTLQALLLTSRRLLHVAPAFPR